MNTECGNDECLFNEVLTVDGHCFPCEEGIVVDGHCSPCLDDLKPNYEK